eukprot:2543878-Lingulodinium_polyedra.AAC.1
MRSFVKVAISVTLAEFPDYELVASFRVFCLDEKKGSVEPTDQEVAKCFMRLAKFFHVDMASLRAEFFDLLPVAQARKRTSGCSNSDAWQHAVTRACAKRAGSCRYR